MNPKSSWDCMSDQKESTPQKTTKFILSIFKILCHGFIVLFGLILFNIYSTIMQINLWIGNYIVFIPLILVLLIPFTVIILGAMNSYSVRYVYRRKTDESWLSLLLEGVFVVFIGFLFTVVWSVLIVYFLGPIWPPFYNNFGTPFIIFYLLLLPSIGYTTKEVTIVLFTKTNDSENTKIPF